ncbi:MAG: Abi family protein [Alcaligenaceae bacterium]|nr:Abi family protein [Alcaligenaceae bacterium]
MLARYGLDRDLRRITLGQLERIEIAIRTIISDQKLLPLAVF